MAWLARLADRRGGEAGVGGDGPGGSESVPARLGYETSLSDRQWAVIAPLLSVRDPRHGGRPLE
jgi:hypothetical protein